MQTSAMIVHLPRTARRLLPHVLKSATALLLWSAATAAQTHVIALTRTVEAKGTFPMDISGETIPFSFDVTVPPDPGPIFAHGEQHYYYETRVFFLQLHTTTGEGDFFETGQDLGKLTKTITVNQSLLTEDVRKAFSSGSRISQAYLALTDYYAPPGVPEPAQWALMIGGFAATGAALRRRAHVTNRAAAQLA